MFCSTGCVGVVVRDEDGIHFMQVRTQECLAYYNIHLYVVSLLMSDLP